METAQILDEIIPHVYESVRFKQAKPAMTDMSWSNQCHNLTYELGEALENRDVMFRRELHQSPENRTWHFVIAHANRDEEPSEDDMITDLNPWQFKPNRGQTGWLHLPRHELQATLEADGAPEYFVALRGVATITDLHYEPRHFSSQYKLYAK